MLASGSVNFFTYAALTNPPSPEEAFQSIVTSMTGVAFAQIDDVNPGTYIYDTAQLAAMVEVAGFNRAASIAQGVLIPTAQGDWLTAGAYSFFNLNRGSGVQAQGLLQLSLASNANPASLLPGQLTVTFGGIYSYTNNDAFTLNGSNLTASIVFTATVPGSAPDLNVPVSSPSSAWAVSPPTYNSITVSNPPVPGTISWVLVHGQDDQADASLQLQCQTQWGTLATNANPANRLLNSIIAFSSGTISEVAIDFSQPNGPGTVLVYCATVDDVASPGDIALISGSVQAQYFDGQNLISLVPATAVSFGAPGQNDAVQIFYNPTLNLAYVSGTVSAAAQLWIEQQPLGGINNAPVQFNGSYNFADIGTFEDAIYDCGGGQVVRNIVIQNRTDIAMGPDSKLQAPVMGWFAPSLQLTSSAR